MFQKKKTPLHDQFFYFFKIHGNQIRPSNANVNFLMELYDQFSILMILQVSGMTKSMQVLGQLMLTSKRNMRKYSTKLWHGLIKLMTLTLP